RRCATSPAAARSRAVLRGTRGGGVRVVRPGGDALGAVDDRISVRRHTIERVLDAATIDLQLIVFGFRRDPDWSPGHDCAFAEGQIEGRPIPVVEFDAAAGCNGYRIDRPTGAARQHYNAQTGNARHLGHVGGEGDDVSFLESVDH